MSTTCINCTRSIEINESVCPTCGVPVAALPNVRAIGTKEEKEALDSRYEKAVLDAESRGCKDVISKFETALKLSLAVVGSDLHVIRQILTNDKALYNNYFSLVNANFRKPASPQNEQRRLVADAILLGSYADKIVFAALSLDGIGLNSYGRYTMILRDIAVAQRATVLEENSFSFVEEKCDVKGQVPLGYRAIWTDRYKLGIAKLAHKITPTTEPDEFPTLVLFNGKNRNADQFMEVHIHGAFDGEAVEAISGPANPKKRDERVIVKILSELLAAAGKKWIDA